MVGPDDGVQAGLVERHPRRHDPLVGGQPVQPRALGRVGVGGAGAGGAARAGQDGGEGEERERDSGAHVLRNGPRAPQMPPPRGRPSTPRRCRFVHRFDTRNAECCSSDLAWSGPMTIESAGHRARGGPSRGARAHHANAGSVSAPGRFHADPTDRARAAARASRRWPRRRRRSEPAHAADRTVEPLNQYAVSGKLTTDQLARAGLRPERGRLGKRQADDRRHARAGRRRCATRARRSRRSPRREAMAAPSTPLTQPTHGYDVFRPWSLTPARVPGHVLHAAGPLKNWYPDLARRYPDARQGGDDRPVGPRPADQGLQGDRRRARPARRRAAR